MNHSNHFGQVLSKTWRPTSRCEKTIPILLLALFLTGKGQAQSNVDSFDPGANGQVITMALQTDGKIVVGGNFTTLGGGASTRRDFIGRLNPDGTVDTSFNPGAGAAVSALAIQADGKILVGGAFSTLGGGTRRYIGRLNTDGTLDTSFDPGAGGALAALAVQADGKILVGGSFLTLGGGGTGTTPRNYIGRLNPDGTLDTSFDPGAGSLVYAFALQADDRILVGGNFTYLGVGGTGITTRSYIARLNSDGSVDDSFDPGASGPVSALALQADGRILVGGNFTTLGSGPRNYTAGSTQTARWTSLSIPVQADLFMPWRCKATVRFWPGEISRHLAAAAVAQRHATISDDSIPMEPSTLTLTLGRVLMFQN